MFAWYESDSLQATETDRRLIMMYPIPASWTTGGAAGTSPLRRRPPGPAGLRTPASGPCTAGPAVHISNRRWRGSTDPAHPQLQPVFRRSRKSEPVTGADCHGASSRVHVPDPHLLVA